MFQSYQVYQEYPVNKVCTTYPDGSHKFDWVVLGINLVVECHGKQHYHVQNFGMSNDKAVESFEGIKKRDEAKRQAAINAGFKYLIISYKQEKDLTAQKLLDLIKRIPDAQPVTDKKLYQEKRTFTPNSSYKEKQKEIHEEYLKSEEHQLMLKQARENRREQYKRDKQRKDKMAIIEEDDDDYSDE